MKCSHQVVHIALEQYALGSAYLKVTLCMNCPQVWIKTGFPLSEDFMDHTHYSLTDINGNAPPPLYSSKEGDSKS